MKRIEELQSEIVALQGEVNSNADNITSMEGDIDVVEVKTIFSLRSKIMYSDILSNDSIC